MNSTKQAGKQGMQGEHVTPWLDLQPRLDPNSSRSARDWLFTRVPLTVSELGARDFHCPPEGDWDRYTYTQMHVHHLEGASLSFFAMP